ncbi:MAG: T9SS type A sorting domain-containing protein [Bacteroidetes bacterium]|nr:T9SS type A sorting domain-containing protein [Bacteroidota bacterium]
MKHIFTSIYILFITTLFAQAPQLEGTYLPVRGTAIKQVYKIWPMTMAEPATGANQTWNYSGVFTPTTSTYLLETFDTNDVRCKPYSKYFPTATHVSFLGAPFKDADSSFFFFRIDTSGVWGVGSFNIQASVDTFAIATDPEFMTPANFTYLSTARDTLKAYSPISNTITMVPTHVHGEKTKIKVDTAIGYGTLTTPVGTFNDVLLIKEWNFNYDSIFLDQTKSLLVYSQLDTFIRYYYLRNNTFGSNVLLLQHFAVINKNKYPSFSWYTLPVDNGYIKGTVLDSNNTAITNSMCPTCEVYLYREHSNFSKDDILARTTLDANGNYQFDSIPYGEYRISFRPDNSVSPYYNALTTYYGDSTDWTKVTPINTLINKSDTTLTKPIVLQYHNGNDSTQLLRGQLNINLGVSKNGPSVGDAPYLLSGTVPGVDIIIKKCPCGGSGAIGKPSNEVRTDANGMFQFNKLDTGTYELFIDIPGLPMASTYPLTINASSTSITNLDFTIGRDSIHANNILGLTVKTYSQNSFAVNAYPNPISNELNLSYLLNDNELVSIQLVDMLGRPVTIVNKQYQTKGLQELSIDVSSYQLNAGLYFVKITTSKNQVTLPISKLN